MFGLSRRARESGDAVVTVAVIGEGYRRSYVKDLLGDRTRVAAELASDRRVHLLAEIDPGIIVLDCASDGTNPLLALPQLSRLEGSPRVVALTDGSVSLGLDADVLLSLGADATADIRDPRAVAEAVAEVVLRTGTEPPSHRVLAAA